MVRQLKNNDAINGVLALVIVLFSLIAQLVLSSPNYYVSETLLHIFRVDYNSWPQALVTIVSLSMGIITMVLINRAAQSISILGQISSFPILISALILATMPDKYNTPSTWLCIMLSIHVLINCSSMLDKSNVNAQVFQAGAAVSIISILEPSLFGLLLLPFYTLINTRAVSARSTVLLVISFFLPWYFLLSLDYIFSPETPWQFLPHLSGAAIKIFFAETWIALVVGVFAILSIMAVGFVPKASTLIIRQRWQLLIGMFVASMIGVGLKDAMFIVPFAYVAIVLIFSRLLLTISRNWVGDLLLVILLILGVINQMS